MKILLIGLLTWSGGQVMSQSLQRITFSSGGTNSPQLTATIGEPIAASNPGALIIGAQPGDDSQVNNTSTASKLTGIQILPNPTDGILGVVANAGASYPLQAAVYALNGDLLFEQSLNSGYNSVDMCILPASTYLLAVRSQTASVSFQIIKL